MSDPVSVKWGHLEESGSRRQTPQEWVDTREASTTRGHGKQTATYKFGCGFSRGIRTADTSILEFPGFTRLK